MKKLFALLLLVSSTAFGDIDPRLFGLWHVTDPVYSDEDLTVRLDVTFSPENATMAATCIFPRNVKVEVSVTSKVRYTATVIRPLESKEVSKQGPNGQECVVAIQPFDIFYKIKSEKQMEISDATGFQKFRLHKD